MKALDAGCTTLAEKVNAFSMRGRGRKGTQFLRKKEMNPDID